MTKVAIGMPHCGTISAQTVLSLIKTAKHLTATNIPYEFVFQQGSVLHWNREQIVKGAIKTGCTHLLFVDSDMSFEGDAASRLLARDKDIVGVHYNRRGSPPTTTVTMDPEKKASIKEKYPDGFLTCDAVATGFMLIRLSIMEKLPHPWFFWKSDKDGNVSEGEDYWFCRQARDKGLEVWVDLTIPIKHVGDHLF